MRLFIIPVIALQGGTTMGQQPHESDSGTHKHLVAMCAEVPPGQKRPEFGCFIIATKKGLQFIQPTVYWHLRVFPSRAAAEAVKSPTGIVVEEDGRVWLSEFGPQDSAPRGGEGVAVIGPLELPPAKTYDAVLSYAVMRPGDRSHVHTHPGAEGWYMLAGEQCLETQSGMRKARTGETMTVSPNVPMELSIVGTTVRRSLVLIIHDSAQAAIIPSDWKPSGACNTNQSSASQPLILQEADGEHLRRRYAEQAAAASPGSIPEFTIKTDKQNGGAEDFVALTENLNPGATIPFHMHHNAEEILLLEEDGATVTVGDKRALAGPRSIVFIPRETWASVTNSAAHPIHLYALFSRPGFEDYLRARSVHPGEPVAPLTSEERHKAEEQGHAMFWDVSKGPYPPGVAQSTEPSGSKTAQSSASPYSLILQEADGEHRVARPVNSSHGQGQSTMRAKPFSFTIKVDGQNGNAQDFLVMTNMLEPGDVIPFHQHHNAEEVIILEEGGATVTVGDKRAAVGPRSIVFIPRETWVSVANGGKQSIHLSALFSRQGFERYLRAASVPESQQVTPLSPEELARLRETGHATYWDKSKGPYPPGVVHP